MFYCLSFYAYEEHATLCNDTVVVLSRSSGVAHRLDSGNDEKDASTSANQIKV